MITNGFRTLPVAFICLMHSVALVQAEGQLSEPIDWIAAPGQPGHFWMSQNTNDATLHLTANTAFFPTLGLKAEGQGSDPDIDNLNGGKSFATITGWKPGLAAEWGVYFARAGRVQIATDVSSGGTFSLGLGSQTRPVKGDQSNTFTIDQPGRYSVTLTCTDTSQRLEFRRLKLAGDAVDGAAVIRKRFAADERFERVFV